MPIKMTKQSIWNVDQLQTSQSGFPTSHYSLLQYYVYLWIVMRSSRQKCRLWHSHCDLRMIFMKNLHRWFDTYLVKVKSTVKIWSIFVAFLENMNFKSCSLQKVVTSWHTYNKNKVIGHPYTITSRNKLKKHSATKNWSDLSLFE